MTRENHEKILELIEYGLYTHKDILEELLHFLSEVVIKDFVENSFGGIGLEDL